MLYTHFIGRIGKNGAKVIDGKNGSFISMDVATDTYAKGENKTMWIRVRSSKSVHIKLADFLTQGRLILVQGSQQEDSVWTGKDGKTHTQHVIIADSIDFVRSGKRKDENTEKEETPEPVAIETTQEPEAPFPAPSDDPEDLPF